jgi:hypothetical protein
MSRRTLVVCVLLVVGTLVIVSRNVPAPSGPLWLEAAAADAAVPAKPAGKADAGDPFAAPGPAKAAEKAGDVNPFIGDAPAKPAPPVAKPAVATPAKAEPAEAKSPPAAPAPKTPRPEPPEHSMAGGGRPLSPGERALLRALDSPASLEFVETPLADVVAFLQDKYKVPIWLDKREMESMSVGADTLVTCNLHDIPLSSALTLVLDDLGLEWTIWSDVLLITSPTRAASDALLITRIYDVSDLIEESPNRRDAGGLPSAGTRPDGTHGGGGGPRPTGAPGPIPRGGLGDRAMFEKGPADDLIDVITTTLSPESWQDNGGKGAIKGLDRAIVVSHTLRIHRELAAFLADLRAARQAVPALVVQLQWLWLSAAGYEDLNAQPARGPAAGRTPLALDAKTLDRLARTTPGFRGHVACGNGQWVHLASGERRSVVAEASPIVGGGSVAYQPAVDVPSAGVLVRLRPTVAPGAESAILDVECAVTRWGGPRPTARVGGAASGSSPVERPNIPTAHLATTVRVPLGQPVLVGGITIAPSGPAGPDEAGMDPVDLYLIATMRIAADPAELPPPREKR